jgi:hypothetical protein
MAVGNSTAFLILRSVDIMSGLFKAYKTDSAAETDGVNIEFFDAQNEDGTIPTFKVSRLGKTNKKYTKALEVATRPPSRQIELGVLKTEVSEKIFLDVFCSTILIGWSNVMDEDGNPIKYSKDNAIKLMTDLPDLYERIQNESAIASNFRDASLEAESKN